MSKLYVISGPSGVGKGTLVKMIQEYYQENNKKLYLSVSCTTREMREGEAEGVSYYYISEAEFLKKIEDGDFLEYNKYGTGKYYGTPKSKVIEYLNKDYDVILEIDINGYKQIKANYPDAVGIFITAPTLEDLRNRLINRGTETEDVIEQRIETAKKELKEIHLYDHIIVNEDNQLDKSFNELKDIMSC